MWFLLDYDRRRGEIVAMRTFAVSQREQAEEARLDLELALSRANVEREVVVLEATNEEALRRTHQRYFATWDNLAHSASA